MSGELHEISAAIGELRGDLRAANQQRAETISRLDEVNQRLGVLATKLDAMAPLSHRMDRIESMVDNHETVIQRAKGAVTVIGAGAGIGGGGAAWLLLKMMGFLR